MYASVTLVASIINLALHPRDTFAQVALWSSILCASADCFVHVITYDNTGTLKRVFGHILVSVARSVSLSFLSREPQPISVYNSWAAMIISGLLLFDLCVGASSQCYEEEQHGHYEPRNIGDEGDLEARQVHRLHTGATLIILVAQTGQARVVPHECQCCICMEDPPSEPVTTPCSHVFCRTCLQTWVLSNATCPVCRAETTVCQLMLPCQTK